MKTDELIAFLAQDLTPVRRGGVPGLLVLGFGGGVLLSAALMMALLGPRPDLGAAMTGDMFWMKFVYTSVLALLGFLIVQRQARAGVDSRRPILWLAAPVVILITVAGVQFSAPTADTAHLVMGDTWTVCPWLIVLLSLPIFAGLLLVLRRLAPTRLALTGAAAGLVAGAGAATVYGFHCPESAAPFILIWYTFGIALAAGLGALIGQRALRW